MQRSIEIIDNPTVEVFSDYLFSPRPLLLRTAIETWPALQRWSPEYLASQYGEALISIDTYDLEKIAIERRLKIEAITMSQAVKLIRRDSDLNKNKIYSYMSAELPAALKQDLLIRSLFQRPLACYSFWLSSGGNITRLHFDLPHGLLVQIYGTKKIYLFPPEDTPFLYPNDPQKFLIKDRYFHFSQIPNTQRAHLQYPQLTKANAWVTTLHPGEILFIPSGWWHEVHALDVAISVTLSFPATILEAPVTQFSRYFAYHEFEEFDFTKIDQFLDFGEFGNETKLIQFLVEKQHYVLALLFLGNYLYTRMTQVLSVNGIPFSNLLPTLDLLLLTKLLQRHNLPHVDTNVILAFFLILMQIRRNCALSFNQNEIEKMIRTLMIY